MYNKNVLKRKLFLLLVSFLYKQEVIALFFVLAHDSREQQQRKAM